MKNIETFTEEIETLADLAEEIDVPSKVFNDNFKNEKSRFIKFVLIKYKCILIITFLIIVVLQFLYLLFKDMNDQGKLYNLLEMYVNEMYNMSSIKNE